MFIVVTDEDHTDSLVLKLLLIYLLRKAVSCFLCVVLSSIGAILKFSNTLLVFKTKRERIEKSLLFLMAKVP